MSYDSSGSLLKPKSTGGEHARRGYEFQDNYFVSQIPYWIIWDGFSEATQEAMGDIEVKMYSPEHGPRIELMEVKNHDVKPAEFWKIVDHFYEVDKVSPDTFQWFSLVATGYSQELNPLQNGLRRLRSNYGFYDQDSGVAQQSFSDFLRRVRRWDKPENYADFLYYRVSLEVGHGITQESGEALFRNKLHQHLPQYRDLPYDTTSAIYNDLHLRLKTSRKPISRAEIEETIRSRAPAHVGIHAKPTRLHTVFDHYRGNHTELILDWRAFSGQGERDYPDSAAWNAGVRDKLQEVKAFILNYRSTKKIKLTGNRRLSCTVAIGRVFSATDGFSVAMEYRNNTWWHTDDHAAEDGLLDLAIEYPVGQSNSLYVAIGIPTDIRPSVEKFACSQGTATVPILNVVFPNPIQYAQQANALVAQVKEAIGNSLTRTNATKIHLFCRVPSFVALLLGHRLNATAKIQCYEFVGPDNYVPSCLLLT